MCFPVAIQFIVGYLDRIEGLKEKYFNAFSWEHIASVDYTVLAIPKHRIQFFKYKEESLTFFLEPSAAAEDFAESDFFFETACLAADGA